MIVDTPNQLNGATRSGGMVDTIRTAAATLNSEIADGVIIPQVTPQEIREYLTAHYSFKEPADLNDVSADVERLLRKWQVQVTHPRYMGLFNPSVTPASIVADTLVAMYNPQLATWRTSPAANEIERHVLGWFADKFGLPVETVANFTTGGAEANLSAVIVALTRRFPGYGDEGLRHVAATPTIYLSSEAHHSFNKIAHMTGLGRSALRVVAINCDLKMDLADLTRRVVEDRKNGFLPFLVVGTAGTTAAGVIDPLSDLARFCRAEDLWLHVDAAWGGAAIISPKLKHYFDGIQLADSVTCDAHKWFSVPMGAGMFFCRHREALCQAFRAETTYMPGKTLGPVLDPYTSTMQWSRRFIGLKLFLALAHYGESGYIDMIERQTRMGNVLREALRSNGWQIVNHTPLPVVCFTCEGLNTSKFITALHERQIAWMSEVRLDNAEPVIRACITSYRTTEADIDRVVREIGVMSGDSVQQLSVSR